MVSDVSPKQIKGLKFIGYKGLGFRSVLGWVSSIAILSGNAKIGFSQKIAEKWLDKIKAESLDLLNRVENHFQKTGIKKPIAILDVPFWLGARKIDGEIEKLIHKGKGFLDQAFDTVVCLSFSSPEKTLPQVKKQLDSIRSETFLFLQHITKMSIDCLGVIRHWDVVREEDLIMVTPEGGESQIWDLFSDEDEIPKEYLSKEILKPWFKNSSILKYYTKVKSDEYLLYLTRDINLSDYKDVQEHIIKFEKIIKNRPKDRGEIQAALKLGKWWVVFATRKSIPFNSAKIVVPQRSQFNTFGYNKISWYASADVYFITEKDKSVYLKYVLALLNSKLYYLWLYHRGKRKGEMLELYQKPLSEIPIKIISEDEQKSFIEIVDKILSITQSNDYLQNPQEQAKVKSLEAEIDQLVYKLYDLTLEEIEIVEGKDENRNRRN